jgi:hypothetical protein
MSHWVVSVRIYWRWRHTNCLASSLASLLASCVFAYLGVGGHLPFISFLSLVRIYMDRVALGGVRA